MPETPMASVSIEAIQMVGKHTLLRTAQIATVEIARPLALKASAQDGVAEVRLYDDSRRLIEVYRKGARS